MKNSNTSTYYWLNLRFGDTNRLYKLQIFKTNASSLNSLDNYYMHYESTSLSFKKYVLVLKVLLAKNVFSSFHCFFPLILIIFIVRLSEQFFLCVHWRVFLVQSIILIGQVLHKWIWFNYLFLLLFNVRFRASNTWIQV